MSVPLVDFLAMSPQAFALVMAAVVLVVLVLCATFLLALHISGVRSVKGADKAAAIQAIGDAVKSFPFWRRK
ncbi:hypothetical protein ABZS61_25860 [Streptomyces sp. NPDC005566]|uniref:hypothetical protein n=1 Tax=Streptomyces sp. NPDC005566 TaxID=3156886 RepID=UPI0033AA93EF